jgi:hypothetical protein
MDGGVDLALRNLRAAIEAEVRAEISDPEYSSALAVAISELNETTEALRDANAKAQHWHRKAIDFRKRADVQWWTETVRQRDETITKQLELINSLTARLRLVEAQLRVSDRENVDLRAENAEVKRSLNFATGLLQDYQQTAEPWQASTP